MSCLAIAYPKLNDADFNWIQEYRQQYDELFYGIVEPHFTIVFPVFYMEPAEFVEEIEGLSSDFKPIEFEIKCATINHDAFAPYYHEFLVPDKGFSDIVKMHDRLYSGKLFSNLRLDIDFVPHIAIGNSEDPLVCKRRVDDLNKSGLRIAGEITHLDIIVYENDKVDTVKKIQLGA